MVSYSLSAIDSSVDEGEYVSFQGSALAAWNAGTILYWRFTGVNNEDFIPYLGYWQVSGTTTLNASGDFGVNKQTKADGLLEGDEVWNA